MKFVEIEYKVTKESHSTIDEIFDMFRYSRDSVIDIIDKNTWIMRRTIFYEDNAHLYRRLQFFKKQVIVRWKSCGCEIEIVKCEEKIHSIIKHIREKDIELKNRSLI